MVLSHGKSLYNAVLAKPSLPPVTGSIFDEFYRGQDVIFQSGVPGFDYTRRNVNPRSRFVGALLPYRGPAPSAFPYGSRVRDGQRVVLVSQGTIDNHDAGKLITPALDALVNTGALVVVATGHRNTDELRLQYRQENVVIEDYVDFDAVLQRADLYVTNGGYGGVLLSLTKGVPMVTAGVREGKNDVNARVAYFQTGIDLRTEKPSSSAIAGAAKRVLGEPQWKANAMRLRDEFAQYRALDIIEDYLATTCPTPGPGGSWHGPRPSRSGADPACETRGLDVHLVDRGACEHGLWPPLDQGSDLPPGPAGRAPAGASFGFAGRVWHSWSS